MRVPICSHSERCCTKWRRASLPFDGGSSGEICGTILHKEPLPPSQVNPQISAELETVIRKALEKDRNLRYQHASELRADLQRLKRDSDSSHHSAAVVSGNEADAATAGVASRGSGSAQRVAPSNVTGAESSPDAQQPRGFRWKVVASCTVGGSHRRGRIVLALAPAPDPDRAGHGGAG